MQSTSFKALFCALAGLSLLGIGSAAQAQATLSLTPLVLTASQGDTITFILDLTGGTNVGVYTTRVTLDPTILSFVGTAPFTETFSGFDSPITDTVSSPGVLDISYGAFGAAINNVGPTELGTFQVQVNSPLPALGTPLTLTAPSGATSADPSSVTNAGTGANELTAVAGTMLTPDPAPEPSGALAALIGAAGLGLLVWRKRHAL